MPQPFITFFYDRRRPGQVSRGRSVLRRQQQDTPPDGFAFPGDKNTVSCLAAIAVFSMLTAAAS